MTHTELINALRRLKIQTNSFACLGCGHEHNCGIHGCAIIREAAERLGDFNAVFNEETVVRLAGRCLKVEPGRLRELAEADKDGRVVALPCKVGQRVFALLDTDKHISECEVKQIGLGNEIGFVGLEPIGARGREYGVSLNGFGKTVFLTREEVEEALEAMKDE